MTNKKDLILLAKEIHPEEFKEMQEQMQEQIEQLKEPISQDDAGDAPDRWSKLTDRVEKAEALAARRLKSLNAWKETAKENRVFYQTTMGTAKSNQLKWHKAEALAAARKKLLRRCYVRLHSEFDEVNEDGLYDVELCDLLTEIEKELGDE